MEITDENIIISNIEKYNISFYKGNMILTRKKEKITFEDLKNYDFKHSNILICQINNIKLDFTKYTPIIFYIYCILNNTDLIIENSLLNIKEGKIRTKGFKYMESLDISVQGADSNKTIQEIYHMAKLGNIETNIKIQLENETIINI